MQRFFGFVIILAALVLMGVHWTVGLHDYFNQFARLIWGAHASEAAGSVVAEGFTYMLLYFIALLGLVLVGTAKSK